MSAQSLSGSCLSYFKEQLPLQQYNSWIKPLIFEIDGDKLVLTAPNSFTLRIIQERFLPEISKRALPFFSNPPQIELRIEKKAAKNLTRNEPSIVSNKHSSVPVSKPSKNQNKLNSSLVFDTFVTGKANQLAHAAAIQVAETPGVTYNPLF